MSEEIYIAHGLSNNEREELEKRFRAISEMMLEAANQIKLERLQYSHTNWREPFSDSFFSLEYCRAILTRDWRKS